MLFLPRGSLFYVIQYIVILCIGWDLCSVLLILGIHHIRSTVADCSNVWTSNIWGSGVEPQTILMYFEATCSWWKLLFSSPSSQAVDSHFDSLLTCCFYCLPYQQNESYGGFLSHGSTPSSHPFTDGFSTIFHGINHPAMGVPPWLWKLP